MSYTAKTPVALVVFNRYDNAMQVFERIREVKPSKLYVIADGPRPNHPTDAEKCKKVRAICDKVDWGCQLYKNFSDTNLGCSQRPYTGISWVFEQEERAIILEDDCVPDLSFFRYCDENLERYKDDERIMLISGMNVNNTWEKEGYSYHFSKLGGIHGWASWSRAWDKVDIDIKLWQDPRTKQLLEGNHRKWPFYCYSKIYDRLLNNSHNTSSWDYQFGFARRVNSGLTVVPSSNLITNIGYGEDATHTTNKNARTANLKRIPLDFPLKHPSVIVADELFDKLYESILFRKDIRSILSYLYHKYIR